MRLTAGNREATEALRRADRQKRAKAIWGRWVLKGGLPLGLVLGFLPVVQGIPPSGIWRGLVIPGVVTAITITLGFHALGWIMYRFFERDLD